MNNNRVASLISKTDSPVLTTFAATFISASEDQVRKISRARGKKYRSLTTAINRRLSMEAIITATKTALQEAMFAAASTDTSKSNNRLKEDAMKQSFKLYLSS